MGSGSNSAGNGEAGEVVGSVVWPSRTVLMKSSQDVPMDETGATGLPSEVSPQTSVLLSYNSPLGTLHSFGGKVVPHYVILFCKSPIDEPGLPDARFADESQ